MAKWHLVTPSGGIVRTCEADSLGEARFRLAPLHGGMVVSAASYATTERHADFLPPVRQRIAFQGPRQRKAKSEARAKRLKAERQRRYTRKKLKENPRYWMERKLSGVTATERGLPVTMKDGIVRALLAWRSERDVAVEFGVSQQAVNNVRVAYRVPTPRDMATKQNQVLAWYHREVCQRSVSESAHRMGVSRRYFQTLIRGFHSRQEVGRAG